MVEKIDSVTPDWQTSIDFLRRFALNINNIYGVNPRVIEVRLERKSLWAIPQ